MRRREEAEVFEDEQVEPAAVGPQQHAAGFGRVGAPRRGGNGAVALLCLASAAVAAALIAFFLYQPVPASLATTAAPTWITLTEEELSDSRLVDLDLTLGDESTLRAPVTGLITGSSCTPGGTIASGTTAFRVDKLPLVSLHTAIPLWRDLSFGVEGDDVAALQRELSRLGYLVTETERFDWQTWVAWDALTEGVGGDTDYGSLALSQVLWVPETETRVAACPLGLGQSATQSEPLVTLPRQLISGAVTSYPADLVPGERRLIVDETDIEVDDLGQLSAPGLSALEKTDAFTTFSLSPDDAAPTAELVLANPVTVYPVTPAAIAMIGEVDGCVTLDTGDAVAVAVVASRLGRSYISFANAPESARLHAKADRGLTCS